MRAAGLAGERLAAPTILLLLIAVLGAALRFSHLADKSFWFDEGLSVGIARLGWYDFLQLLGRRELNMAPYYLLLKGWLELGRSEFFVRSLSVLAALATVPALYQLGKRLFDARVGLTAALLLAVNAYHVRYAQEARSYTLLVLLCVLSTLWLIKAVEKPARGTWLAYAALSVVVVYCHFYGVLVVAAQWASLLIMRRHEVARREFLRSACWVVVLCLPIAITALFAGASGLQFVRTTSAAGVWQFIVSLAGNGGGLLVAAHAVALAAAAAAAWTAWRKHGRSFELWRYGLLFFWLVLPIALVLAASVARPMFVGRYLISSLPALVLLSAAGIWRLRPGGCVWP